MPQVGLRAQLVKKCHGLIDRTSAGARELEIDGDASLLLKHMQKRDALAVFADSAGMVHAVLPSLSPSYVVIVPLNCHVNSFNFDTFEDDSTSVESAAA